VLTLQINLEINLKNYIIKDVLQFIHWLDFTSTFKKIMRDLIKSKWSNCIFNSRKYIKKDEKPAECKRLLKYNIFKYTLRALAD
jgi:hypothetical protein